MAGVEISQAISFYDYFLFCCWVTYMNNFTMTEDSEVHALCVSIAIPNNIQNICLPLMQSCQRGHPLHMSVVISQGSVGFILDFRGFSFFTIFFIDTPYITHQGGSCEFKMLSMFYLCNCYAAYYIMPFLLIPLWFEY